MQSEKYLRNSGLDWTIVRLSLATQAYLIMISNATHTTLRNSLDAGQAG